MVKNLPAMLETKVQSLGQKDPLRRKWQPTPVFLPGEFHGQRNLTGYSPWDCKESDTQKHIKYFKSCNQNTSQKILFPPQKRNIKHESRNDNVNLAIKKKKNFKKLKHFKKEQSTSSTYPLPSPVPSPHQKKKKKFQCLNLFIGTL